MSKTETHAPNPGATQDVTSTTEDTAHDHDDATRVVVEARPGYGQTRSVRVEPPRPSGAEYARRVTLFVTGIVQSLIGLRILLLLLDARASNGLVAVIFNLSQLFVAPFEGVLHTNALKAGGSTLDIAALLALLGWTLLEGLVIAGIGIFRREPSLA